MSDPTAELIERLRAVSRDGRSEDEPDGHVCMTSDYLDDVIDTLAAEKERAESADREQTRLWEALFWVSEWPNRHAGSLTAADNEAVMLAEYAREHLDAR